MKLSVPSALLAGLLLLLAIPAPASAQLNAELQASTVRIICPAPAKDGGKGFRIIPLHLANGETVSAVNYSFGTGFVINNDGVIVTNNHVVAIDPLKDTPRPLVMVMQKVGNQYVLHKASVLWQSPNGDLGIVRAPDLKAAPLPILFDETKSTPSEEVYSMGFPGITDLAEENFDRSQEVRRLLIRNTANNKVQELEHQQHRTLGQAEVDAIVKEVASKQDLPATDWMALLADLSAFLQNADGNANAWDVTEVIGHQSLWADYFKPTVTKGSIERIAKIHGFLGVAHADVLMFQHSCPIKHGNSGGPLLNAGGQVIGVVGRGEHVEKNGEREEIKWATAAGELQNWFEANHIAYIPAGEWRKAAEQSVKIIEQLPATIIEKPTLRIVERLPVKMIVAISVAVLLAIVVAALGFLRTKEAPSITTLLRDPRLASALGTTPEKLLEADEPRLRRPAGADHSGAGRWQLAGRTSNGAEVCLDLTEEMFADNDQRLILGRAADLCHVVVDDDSVSKQHAHIRKEGDQFLVADRNSANHTTLNGTSQVNVFDETPLNEGDTLTLGEVRLDFTRA